MFHSTASLAAWRLCLPLVCLLAAAGLYLSPGQEIQAKPGLRRQTSAGLRQSGIWQPSMPRISSGHAMHDMQHRRSMEMQQWRGQAVAHPDTDGASSSAATSAAGSRKQQQLCTQHQLPQHYVVVAWESYLGTACPNAASSWRAQQLADQHLTVPHSGQLAMDCLGSDATHPIMHEVAQGKGKAKGKAFIPKPAPQPGRWLDRDCNASLNVQRIGESRWRPLELC
ncbi:hypothetical protein QJQ45_011347 [Haematococcus lacustris]|nr:hypothetical protein QJQ45_011347 [Haematococcus lacustris]